MLWGINAPSKSPLVSVPLLLAAASQIAVAGTSGVLSSADKKTVAWGLLVGAVKLNDWKVVGVTASDQMTVDAAAFVPPVGSRPRRKVKSVVAAASAKP